MSSHGLTGCARVYLLPAGVQYLVVGDVGDYRNGALLQLLKGAAVQLVIEDDYEQVFVWPEPAIPPEGAS